MSAQRMDQLLKKKFTISSEEEDYILTPEEESKLIAHAIERAKEHKHWRFRNEFNLSEMETISRISQIDFEKEINKDEILKFANSCKHQENWQNERREKEKEEKIKKEEDLQKAWTAKRTYALMKWSSLKEYDRTLILNENNKHLITALCYFISNDERFENELGYSFKKGLLIRGTTGLGKTFLVRCVERNELNPILILSMLDIADDIRQNGEYQINLGENKMIYLDDVGTEEATVNHYGTKINFFKNFIEQCYLRNKTFNKLMMSTNNSFAEIEQKYGFRVRSRMKDMFNIVDIKGEDMRG